MNKKRIVAREPLPVFAMLDTCFSMAERGGFTYSYSGTRLMRCERAREGGREGSVYDIHLIPPFDDESRRS